MPSEEHSARGLQRAGTARKILLAPGVIPALIALAALTALRVIDPTPVETVRMRAFDLEQRIAPRTYVPLGVRIVAIDDKTVDKYGQWPWPRTLLAQLITKIAEGHPSVLGVDIIFLEKDRFSPEAIAREVPGLPDSITRQLKTLPASEGALAKAFQLLPTVLIVDTSGHEGRGNRAPSRVTMIRQYGADPSPFLKLHPPPLRSVAELTAVEAGSGADVGLPDADGIVRRLPLYVDAEGNLLPALVLEMLRVMSGSSLGIATSRTGILGATIGNVLVPTDGQGRAYPYFTPSYEDRYISAADILDGRYDLSQLRGKVLFLGVTALGLVDEKQTPRGLMEGAEVHAQLLESIVTGSLLRRPAIAGRIEIGLIVTLGLLTIFAVPYRQPSFAFAIVGVAAAAMIGAEFAGFRMLRLLFDGIYPAVASLLVFGVMLQSNLRAAEAARRRLAADLERERREEARIEGELKAARSIQMGLLPRRFPDAARTGVDIYASIEPARMVGGDLYDFILLESNRLVFTIADVSGKGVPAALFMAMTKAVLNGATQRYGDALDRVFDEANAEVSGSSNELAAEGANMMFVTAFAGILDLASGMLHYVNAGHDNPFVIRPKTNPVELAGESGPPLGTVDDFAYQVQRRQLDRGDLLLLYTDGVTEAQNPAHAFYGEVRLRQVLASHPASDAKTTIETVRDDVRHFVAGAEPSDDITMLAVRWLGLAVPAS